MQRSTFGHPVHTRQKTSRSAKRSSVRGSIGGWRRGKRSKSANFEHDDQELSRLIYSKISTFVLTYPPDEIPEAIIGFARLLIEEEAWERAQDKGKVPKPKIEQTANGVEVVRVLLRSIELRRSQYTCSFKVFRMRSGRNSAGLMPFTFLSQDDLSILAEKGRDTMGLYDYMARVVRTGEGRVLSVAENILSSQKADIQKALTGSGGKRKAEGGSGQQGKKSKTRTKIA
jgi:hypothetical protein